jgi:spermidine synthase
VTVEDDRPLVLHREETPRGELVLRRVGGHLEIISNGVFLMDTRDGGSERALVREALAHLGPRGDGAAGLRVLVGGLGVGFSLLEALADPRVAAVTVAEIEPRIVAWHATHLAAVSAGALDDPRVRVVLGDLYRLLETEPARYDVICVDTDNGPGWTVVDGNARLYGDEGLALLRRRLAPGGVLAVWSPHHDPEFALRLSRHVGECRHVTVPTAAGTVEPDHVYLARA